jgi:hypothetical protein
MIGTTISNSQLEDADKAFGIAIVGGRTGPAHGEYKALLQEQRPGLDSPILFALISMPDTAWHLKSHRFNGVGNQIGTHVVVKRDPHHLACSVPKRKTAANPRAIGQLDLQNSGEDHFTADPLERFLAKLIGCNLGRFAGGDIRASRLRRAAMPYVCITRLMRFFPVPNNAANLRWPMVSSFSCAASIRTASALSALGRLHCTYRLLRAMPSTFASWLLLIGLPEAHSVRASSTLYCLLICPTVRGIFLG